MCFIWFIDLLAGLGVRLKIFFQLSKMIFNPFTYDTVQEFRVLGGNGERISTTAPKYIQIFTTLQSQRIWLQKLTLEILSGNWSKGKDLWLWKIGKERDRNYASKINVGKYFEKNCADDFGKEHFEVVLGKSCFRKELWWKVLNRNSLK